MTDTLTGLRHKLAGAEQLAAVVRAMKAVAASAIGQYESAVRSLGDYEESVERGLSVCLRGQQPAEEVSGAPGRDGHLAPARDGPVGLLVFGSDQGLVGRFNELIAEQALRMLRSVTGPATVWAVGERVCSQLEDAGQQVAKRFAVPSSVAGITPLVTQIQLEVEGYTAGRGAQIHVLHHRPMPGARHEPAMLRLLPLDAAWHRRLSATRWPNRHLPEVLGDSALAVSALVREYLFISLYKACAESLASENASRLEAMQRAQRNIDGLSAGLRLSLNRLRQSSIDEELFDVIAGFNTLSGEAPRDRTR